MLHTNKKRRATLIWASYFLLLYFVLFLVSYFKWPEYLEWIILVIFFIPPILFHKTFWPFKAHCSNCGQKLAFSEILGKDENYCFDCFSKEFPEEADKEKKEKYGNKKTKEYTFDESIFTTSDKVEQIPWDKWEPTEKCVLNYLFDNDKVLLIHKKRGMGTGYINAPGGHIELEETKVEAAIRETKEETGVDVSELEEMGELYFQFKDGIRMHAYVFFSYAYTGTLIEECDETKPFWSLVKDIDYSLMWEDDKLWLEKAINEHKHFNGYFIFDGNTLIDSKVEFYDAE